jgi:hypothetical protein
MPRRWRYHANLALARPLLNLRLQVGVILDNVDEEDQVENPKRHPLIVVEIPRSVCGVPARRDQSGVQKGEQKCESPNWK